MPTNNDGEKPNIDDFNEPIQYMNDSPTLIQFHVLLVLILKNQLLISIYILGLYLQLLHNILAQDLQIENIVNFS